MAKDHEAVAQRRRLVVELRRKAWKWDDIGDRLGVSGVRAYQIYKDALKLIPAPEVNEHRAEMLAQLDHQLKEMQAIIDAPPPDGFDVKGGVLVDHEGNPVKDHSGRVQASAQIVRLLDRKAKLIGADSPVKVDTSAHITYEMSGVDKDAV